MKLADEQRRVLFEQARELSPELGDLFQNPMEITDADLNEELARYYRLKKIEIQRWEAYKWRLGELLCFPEKVK